MSHISFGSGKSSIEIVKAFATLCIGRNDTWDSFPLWCIRKRITLAHYKRYLIGQVSLGIHPLLNDDTYCWATVDFDPLHIASWQNGPDDVAPAVILLTSLSFYGPTRGLFVEKTNCKGCRVWPFFSGPISVKQVRCLLQHFIPRKPGEYQIFGKNKET